jgi:hypothetical protein
MEQEIAGAAAGDHDPTSTRKEDWYVHIIILLLSSKLYQL